MKSPKISIIIPTLNEEVLLPKLLESIKIQSFTDYEVIVSDAGSKDRTRAIAKEYGATVVDGGMPGVGRNKGAEIAKGEYLCFMDSDIILPEDFLLIAFAELLERKLAGATCRFVPDSDSITDMLIHEFANITVLLSSFTHSVMSGGFFMIVKREMYDRVGGFDESLSLREDHDFAEKVSREASFGFLYRPHVNISVRRYKKEGRLSLVYKYLLAEISNVLNTEDKGKSIEYEFGAYTEEDQSSEDTKKKLILLKRLTNIRMGLEKSMNLEAYDKSKVMSGKIKASVQDSYREFLRLLKVKK